MQKQKILKLFFLLFFVFLYTKLFSQEKFYLTLRNDEVNLRQGPSFQHPIKLVYKKKYLPVLIEDTSENFRKIRDHQNNSGWIHISQLSKKRAALIESSEEIVFKNPTTFSKPLVKLEKGRLCLIKKCKGDWCKIKVENYNGWVLKKSLKGRL